MAFKIIVSPRAQSEIEDAAEYYAALSANASVNFIFSVENAYETLRTSPFFRKRYKNVRSLKLRKFPFALYFTVSETRKTVRVLSCFHSKQNPNKRPFL